MIGVVATVTTWVGAPLLVATATQTESLTAPEPELERTYEFWDRLPIDELEADTTPYGHPNSATAADPAQEVEYLIQVGSFKQLADAEALRAGLILDGHEAQTTEVTLADHAHWFRVLVGPFPTRRETQRAMTLLREQNITSLLLERPVHG